jgi:hypothetical protein
MENGKPDSVIPPKWDGKAARSRHFWVKNIVRLGGLRSHEGMVICY